MYRLFQSTLAISIIFVVVACSDQPTQQAPVGQGLDMVQLLQDRNGVLLTDVCSTMPLEEIADILGLQPNQIDVTDSSDKGDNPVSSACFFKWSDYDIPNAGILLQAMRNPLGEEFPDYIVQFISSKRDKGEQGVDQMPIRYSSFDGVGDDGAYSHESGKYYWRLGDQIVFSIAFNTPHNESEQLSMARQLARSLTKHYIAGK